MRKEIITNRQFMILISIITIASSILYIPRAVSQIAGRDGWLVVLVSGLVGLLNLYVFLWMERLYPGKNLMEIHQQLLGKVFGGLLNFVYLFYFIDISTWVIREFVDFLLITVEPSTPFFVYAIIALLMAVYATFHGVEVFASVSELLFPIIVGIYFISFCLLVNEYHPHYLLPVLENGIAAPFRQFLVTETFFGDVMIISMIINHVRKTKFTPLYATAGIGLTMFFICSAVVSVVMLVGAETAATLTYPTFSLIQNINIANILDRLDILIITMWMIGVFVKITSYFMGSVQALSTILQISNPRAIIIPIALSMIVITRFKVPTFAQLDDVYSAGAWYFSVFQLAIPSLVLLLAIIVNQINKKSA
ncbi:spore gernimation protein [Brevibacillus fluminis]|uniref:Spore gernimation protein n=1 Tax=Brevibacillus fluminis TaxID=511487 RepID=A0A3M8DQA1_9BACL|nr:endospore germination permease [Brevibacillus fluminis]RNB89699.1 spore gernimation protein [Brevibacillus fluminis]